MAKLVLGSHRQVSGDASVSKCVLTSPDYHSQLQLLLGVLQKLSLAKDLETVMFIVRKAARRLTDADGATFVLRDGQQCYYADEDAIAPLWKGKRFPMSMCISGWVMEHGQPTTIEDIYADARIPADAYRPTFVKSLAMVPIRSENPIGAIGIYWSENYTPSEEQLSLLQTLSDSTSVAMEMIQLHSQMKLGEQETIAQKETTRQLLESNQYLETALKELHHRNEELRWLKELSSTLQTCLYIEEAYQLIAQYAGLLLPDTAGILYLMNASHNYLEAMSHWGGPLMIEKVIKPEACLGLRRGATFKTRDPKKELVCEHYKTQTDLYPYTCIPLFAQSDIIGLFCLQWIKLTPDSQLNRRENQEVLASMLAEQIALGVSNIKLRETLRNLSFRDGLTGLYNRRYLEESLQREISRSTRNHTSLAIMMIDIDHFKQFNDNFGHEAGDIVIQAFANVLRNNSRKGDIACRYGGEEFILVLPEMNLEQALIRAQQLHEEVSRIHLRYGGSPLSQITISIGLALFPQHGNSMQEIIAAADSALYEAKNSGRNTSRLHLVSSQN